MRIAVNEEFYPEPEPLKWSLHVLDFDDDGVHVEIRADNQVVASAYFEKGEPPGPMAKYVVSKFNGPWDLVVRLSKLVYSFIGGA